MQFITTDSRIMVENFEIGLIYTITFDNGDYTNSACIGKGLDFVMFQRTDPELLFCLNMTTAPDVSSIELYGGGSGTNDYEQLTNKPIVNGVTLLGSLSLSDLGIQAEITDENPLSVSFISGLGTAATAATTDFATAAQGSKADTAIQSAGSGLSKTDTTINHSNNITEQTNQTFRQVAFDSTGHITGYTDITPAQTAALNSGIDSTKVSQIETNKNNILLIEDANGQKNVLNFLDMYAVGTKTASVNGLTLDLTADGRIHIYGTMSTVAQTDLGFAGTYQNTGTIFTVPTDAYPNPVLSVKATHNGANPNMQFHMYKNQTTPVDDFTYVNSDNNGVLLHQSTYTWIMVRIPATSSAIDTYLDIMICREEVYNAFPNYQPYSLPNTAITPALIECVDNGAKNICNWASATESLRQGLSSVSKTDTSLTITSSGAWGHIAYSVGTLKAGRYVAQIKVSDYNVTSGSCRFGTGASVEGTIEIIGNGTVTYTFTLTSDTSVKLYFYANWANASNVNTFTASDIMICTEAEWKASQTYQPYAMSNAELTEDVTSQEAGFINSTGSATTLTIEGLNTSDNPNCLLMCTDLCDTDAKDSLLFITRYLTNARINKVYGDITPPTISISGDVITLSGMRTYQKITAIAHKHVTLST